MSANHSNTELLAIGKECAHSTCHLVDFLPFKCQHCAESYCQEHFKVQDHSCPKYEEHKHNRIAPNCPFCSTPVAVRPGQDPNARLEEHFAKECSVYLGKAVKKSTPTCAGARCGKTLITPIKCDQCKRQFCPSHRFPSDHSCSVPAPIPASTAAGRANNVTGKSRLLNAASNAVSSAKAATKPTAPITSAPSPSKPVIPNPISGLKTDSRSRLVPPSLAAFPNTSILTTMTPSVPLAPDAPHLPAETVILTKPTPVIKPYSPYAPPPLFSVA